MIPQPPVSQTLTPVLTGAVDPLDWDQLCLYWTRAGLLDTVLQAIQNQHLIHQTLEAEGITVEPAEVEMGMIHWRCQQQLTQTDAFLDWLAGAGLDRQALQDQIAHQLRVEKLMDQIAAPQLSQAYISQKLLLDQVVLSRIVVAEPSQAEELWSQLVEDHRSFTDLAQTHSLLPAGVQITCSRGKLPLVIRAAIDTAEPGQILDPLAVEGLWYLLRLEAVHSLSLQEAQPQLTATLFAEWLQAHRPALPINPQGDAHVCP